MKYVLALLISILLPMLLIVFGFSPIEEKAKILAVAVSLTAVVFSLIVYLVIRPRIKGGNFNRK